MKKGDKIRIIRMDDNNGSDVQARMLDGKVVTISFIDDIGQIHVRWENGSGLALIYGEDRFKVVERKGE